MAPHDIKHIMPQIDKDLEHYLKSSKRQKDWESFSNIHSNDPNYATCLKNLQFKDIMDKNNPWLLKIKIGFELNNYLLHETFEYKGFHYKNRTNERIYDKTIKSVTINSSLINFGISYYYFNKYDRTQTNFTSKYATLVSEKLIEFGKALLQYKHITEWKSLMQFLSECELCYYIYYDNDKKIGPETETGPIRWRMVEAFAKFAIVYKVQNIIKTMLGIVSKHPEFCESTLHLFDWHMQFNSTININQRLWCIMEFAIVYIIEKGENWKWAAKLSNSPVFANYMIRRAIEQRCLPYFNAICAKSWDIRELIDNNGPQFSMSIIANTIMADLQPLNIIPFEYILTLHNESKHAIASLNDSPSGNGDEVTQLIDGIYKEVSNRATKRYGNAKHRESKSRE